MVDDGLYDIYWTPDFTEDVHDAVAYVANELGSPIAARNLLDGIIEILESKRVSERVRNQHRTIWTSIRFRQTSEQWRRGAI